MTKSTLLSQWQTHVKQHRFAWQQAFQDLLTNPVASFFTVSVIAIALALPGSLYLMLENANTLSLSWNNNSQISVFLKSHVDQQQAIEWSQRMQQQSPLITGARYLSKQAALEEFQNQMDLPDLAELLEDNPLPSVMLLNIQAMNQMELAPKQFIQQLSELASRLEQFELVDEVEVDVLWLERFSRLVQLGQRSIIILGAILSLAILLIVGNTVRLLLERKRDTVLIMKLVGGTDAYVKRPFLYAGLWLGLLGGVMAGLLIFLLLLSFSKPIDDLAALYTITFELKPITTQLVLAVLSVSTVVSMTGAWLTATVQLRKLEGHGA